MPNILKRFLQFSHWPFALPCLILLALLLHSGNMIKGGLYADDYIHAAFFLGEPRLEEKGIFAGIGIGDPLQLLRNQFNFFDPKGDNYQALLDYGTLPWWLTENAKLHFFRPLATLTHYMDYQLFPDNTHMMHAMNLLWYALGLCIIFFFYRQYRLPRSVAVLALIFVILDMSIFHVVSWIASRSMLMLIVFGFFCLYAYDKGVKSKRWYWISLLALVIALLTAEGAVGICLYLAAYYFAYEKRSWLKRTIAILPFAVITILWRILYLKAGFGSHGLDFYIDPGHDPQRFIEQSFSRFPANYFELLTGIDIFSGQMNQSLRSSFSWYGLALLAINLWLFWQPLKNNRSFRFFFIASILSLIPSLTISLTSRTMILPNIGFSVVMAFTFYYVATHYFSSFRKIIALLMTIFYTFMHIVLSGCLGLYMTFSTIATDNMDRGNKILDFDMQNKHVVFINSNKPFWLVFLGHELAYKKRPLPTSVRILSSSFYPITVKRTDIDTITMTATPAFQFDSEPVTEQDFSGHHAYLTLHLMGLLRSKDEPWSIGPVRAYEDLTIGIDSLFNHKPKTLRVQWDSNKPKDYLWLYWNKAENQYQLFVMPEVGQEIKLPGMF